MRGGQGAPHPRRRRRRAKARPKRLTTAPCDGGARNIAPRGAINADRDLTYNAGQTPLNRRVIGSARRGLAQPPRRRSRAGKSRARKSRARTTIIRVAIDAVGGAPDITTPHLVIIAAIIVIVVIAIAAVIAAVVNSWRRPPSGI